MTKIAIFSDIRFHSLLLSRIVILEPRTYTIKVLAKYMEIYFNKQYLHRIVKSVPKILFISLINNHIFRNELYTIKNEIDIFTAVKLYIYIYK